MRRKRRAQSSLEYAMIIVAVAGALLGMQTYIKRGLQGKLRTTSDQIGNNFEPKSLHITKETFISSITNTTEHHPDRAKGVMTTIRIIDEQTERRENESWGKP